MPVLIQDDMYEAAAMMTKKQGSEFLLALLHYGFTGEEPTGKCPWLPTFIACKNRIDMSKRARERAQNMANARYSKREDTDKQPVNKPADAQAECTSNMHEQDAQAECTSNMHEQHPEIEYEYENNKSKKKEIKRKKKENPPTVEEVAAYVAEHNFTHVDPETFVSYYASQGWKKANGQALSDWKIACSGWNSRARNRGEPQVKARDTASSLGGKYAAYSEEATS
ncbi:hypothetical protein [uncultured Olegusella sp.]|uniref:hypothetical protein n=1 Tax=uncultured Olegusella sp. TaxID=1979846 RepID=UPI00262046CC|nr:hypothetical protein [uncultured Olegusella sp.]